MSSAWPSPANDSGPTRTCRVAGAGVPMLTTADLMCKSGYVTVGKMSKASSTVSSWAAAATTVQATMSREPSF